MIIHVDMDAFYASIEERDRPELRGKPVIVGGTPEGRGVVAAANYVVRKFGVHSAMPTATALRHCPHAIVLPCRMDHYATVSRQIREIFHRYTPLVEPLAFDEAFLDVAGSQRLFGSFEAIANQVKTDIRNEVQLVASVGVAPNKFLAKLAGDLEKPDGFVVVSPDQVQAFLDPLPVGRIWGVGRATGRAFDNLGVKTIQQLREVSRETLDARFGKMGEHIWRLARGIDHRSVVPDREAKSISHETTFVTDITDLELLLSKLMALTEQVARRLRRHRLRSRTVQIKVRYDDFHTITRAKSLPEPTYSTDEIWEVASNLLRAQLPDRELRVRLIGTGVASLDRTQTTQQMLFDAHATQRNDKLDAVTDEIKDRFGAQAVHRGTTSASPPRHLPKD